MLSLFVMLMTIEGESSTLSKTDTMKRIEMRYS